MLDDVLKGLDSGPGDLNRVTVFTGPRGSGKTVLLQKIAMEAEARGWIAISTSSGNGVFSDLLDQLETRAAGFLTHAPTSRLSGLSIGGLSLSRELLSERQRGWRSQMEQYLDDLARHDVGLLFSVDEARATDRELESFVSTFQFFVRDKRKVALIMAGLPGNVMQMFRADSISFLRRALRRELLPIDQPEVRAVIRDTVEMTGRSIQGAALAKAAEETKGLPFMIQLIGYHAFGQSDAKTISLTDVDNGLDSAKKDMVSMVLEATMYELSDKDRQFLTAMAMDRDESRVSDIADRMGVSSQYVGNYRRRLKAQGVIAPAGRGRVVFAMPMLKELLRERMGE